MHTSLLELPHESFQPTSTQGSSLFKNACRRERCPSIPFIIYIKVESWLTCLNKPFSIESRPILVSPYSWHTYKSRYMVTLNFSVLFNSSEDLILRGMDTFSKTGASIGAHINASESISLFWHPHTWSVPQSEPPLQQYLGMIFSSNDAGGSGAQAFSSRDALR